MLMPVAVQGRLRLVDVPISGDALTAWRAQEEETRRLLILKRRQYYEGTQYEDENETEMAAQGKDPLTDRLPEKDRLHSYSTDVADAIDFQASQLAESFEVIAKDKQRVQPVIDAAMQRSHQLTGEGEADDMAMEDVLKDALQAGDIAAELRWDPVDGVCFWDLWESETVEIDYDNAGNIQEVTRQEWVWVQDESGEHTRVRERVVYDLAPIPPVAVPEDQIIPEGDVPLGQARKRTFWDEREDPVNTEMLGVSFIPWCLLRVSKPLRSGRGVSAITEQVMGHADRYNANEQNSYLISRYNSHGNLAVIGDAAKLQLKRDEVQSKDVADVLTFPGGTALTALTLPTDPSMIEHQRQVLKEAIWQAFGLTRLDPDTVTNIGAVSGYALEILNRKTEGTFRSLRRNWTRDLRQLFNMTLDFVAEMTAPPDLSTNGDRPAFVSINKTEVFPEREVEIRLGTAFIVDQVAINNKFTSGQISAAQALREQGYSEQDIAKIQAEQVKENPAPQPITIPASPDALAGSQTAPRSGATVGGGG